MSPDKGAQGAAWVERLFRTQSRRSKLKAKSNAEAYAKEASPKISTLLGSLTSKQRVFLGDSHRAKPVLKTRRAGGSYAIVAGLLATALAGGEGGYATVAARTAKRVLWNGRPGLKALDARIGLGFTFDNTEGVARAPGGDTVFIEASLAEPAQTLGRPGSQ